MSELRGVTILVVEDDDDTREVLRVMLELCGARVVCAESARDGLQTFRQEQPRAIVSDIAMPGEDGYSLVRKIRSMKSEMAGVPVVALTAFTQAEDRRRAIRAGFKHFVPKPVEIDELAAVVRTVADRR